MPSRINAASTKNRRAELPTRNVVVAEVLKNTPDPNNREHHWGRAWVQHQRLTLSSNKFFENVLAMSFLRCTLTSFQHLHSCRI